MTFFDSIVEERLLHLGPGLERALEAGVHVGLKALAEGLARRPVRGHDGPAPVGLRLHVQEAAQPVLGVADQALGR